jgi:hypothetical protein
MLSNVNIVLITLFTKAGVECCVATLTSLQCCYIFLVPRTLLSFENNHSKVPLQPVLVGVRDGALFITPYIQTQSN